MIMLVLMFNMQTIVAMSMSMIPSLHVHLVDTMAPTPPLNVLQYLLRMIRSRPLLTLASHRMCCIAAACQAANTQLPQRMYRSVALRDCPQHTGARPQHIAQAPLLLRVRITRTLRSRLQWGAGGQGCPIATPCHPFLRLVVSQQHPLKPLLVLAPSL